MDRRVARLRSYVRRGGRRCVPPWHVGARMRRHPPALWQEPASTAPCARQRIAPPKAPGVAVPAGPPPVISGRGLRWRVVRYATLAACLLTPTGAYADSVRVIVDRALIWSGVGLVNVVLNQVPAGTILQVRGRVEDWYEVVLPPGSSGPPGSVGYIRAVQVVPESDAAAGPPPGRPPPT